MGEREDPGFLAASLTCAVIGGSLLMELTLPREPYGLNEVLPRTVRCPAEGAIMVLLEEE